MALSDFINYSSGSDLLAKRLAQQIGQANQEQALRQNQMQAALQQQLAPLQQQQAALNVQALQQRLDPAFQAQQADLELRNRLAEVTAVKTLENQLKGAQPPPIIEIAGGAYLRDPNNPNNLIPYTGVTPKSEDPSAILQREKTQLDIDKAKREADPLWQEAQNKNKLQFEKDLIKARTEAKPVSAVKKTPTDISFRTNLDTFGQSIDELSKAVKKYGNYEFWNAEGRAKLGALPYQLAIQYAKIVDPGSVAREGEVAAAQKYLIPLTGFNNKGWGALIPDYTRDNVTEAAIAHMKKTVGFYEKNYNKNSGNSAQEIPEFNAGTKEEAEAMAESSGVKGSVLINGQAAVID